MGKHGRICSMKNREVKSYQVCKLWQMSEGVNRAGLGNGKVKRKKYLKYLLNERFDEQLARDRGIRLASKSVDDIRAEFESEFGSIYINI